MTTFYGIRFTEYSLNGNKSVFDDFEHIYTTKEEAISALNNIFPPEETSSSSGEIVEINFPDKPYNPDTDESPETREASSIYRPDVDLARLAEAAKKIHDRRSQGSVLVAAYDAMRKAALEDTSDKKLFEDDDYEDTPGTILGKMIEADKKGISVPEGFYDAAIDDIEDEEEW